MNTKFFCQTEREAATSYTIALQEIGVRDFPNEMRRNAAAMPRASGRLRYLAASARGRPLGGMQRERRVYLLSASFCGGMAGSKISPNLAERLAADFAVWYELHPSTTRIWRVNVS